MSLLDFAEVAFKEAVEVMKRGRIPFYDSRLLSTLRELGYEIPILLGNPKESDPGARTIQANDRWFITIRISGEYVYFDLDKVE